MIVFNGSTSEQCVENSCALQILSDLYVQVQPVVEVSTPEEVREAQADVKGAKLFVAQRKQSEDVNKVLVPPEYHIYDKTQL